MGKRKCKQCGKRDDVENMRLVNVMSFCNMNCILAYTKQPKVKKAAKVKINAEKKRAFYDDDIKTRKKAAQQAFNTFVRVRDKGLPCISCDKPDNGQHQRHASHYKSVGSNSALRFHEDNCHASCSVCNNHLSGNIGEYKPRLIDKIGKDRVDWLDTQNQPVKYSAQDYKDIENHFKSKLKLLQ